MLAIFNETNTLNKHVQHRCRITILDAQSTMVKIVNGRVV